MIANGDPPSPELAAEVLGGASLVVAADGGADRALALGMAVDAVVGDLDSLSDEARRAFAGKLHLDADPDRSDLPKAIDYAITLGASAIDVLGAGGGRADHALANLSVLVQFRGRANVRLIDELFEVTLIDGEATVEGPPGTVVSLITLWPAQSVTTRGLRWELDGYPLVFSAHGVHNELRESPAVIRAVGGDVLLFKGRYVDPHA